MVSHNNAITKVISFQYLSLALYCPELNSRHLVTKVNPSNTASLAMHQVSSNQCDATQR